MPFVAAGAGERCDACGSRIAMTLRKLKSYSARKARSLFSNSNYFLSSLSFSRVSSSASWAASCCSSARNSAIRDI